MSKILDKNLRIVKTAKNLIYTWTGYFALILSTFIGRKVFVETIGMAYLGVNGLFTNILSCLNIVDLGLSTAITYSLYRPLAEKNEEKITAILSLFHKLYSLIGILVGVLGLALTPFLSLLITDLPADIPFSSIQLYYVLFVINNAANYFLYYKSVLINADQKHYIVELNYSVSMILMTAVQIVILFCTKSYFLYLVIQIASTILRNISISIITNKRYPYVKKEPSYRLSKEDKQSLTKGIGGLLFQRIGTVIVNSTDTIIISKFINILIAGIYSNYYSIILSLNMVLDQIFSSALSSVGNFNITAGEKEMADIFNKTLFINFWIHGFVSIAFTTMINPLIQIWLGSDYLLPVNVVLILGINFYLNGMRKTSQMFSDALGLYWENRYKPIFEAVTNLILSLIFVHYFGIFGVFLGTACSIVFVCLWAEPYIVFKHALHITMFNYFKTYSKYLIIVTTTGIITYFTVQYIEWNNIIGFIIKCCICVLIPNLVFYLLFRKNKIFKFYYDFALSLIKR